eukprot:m.143720 g.143720  ORF g.143720 m.143720 type:complete len:196 (-) comp16024_c0_seq2:1616-2203(-)
MNQDGLDSVEGMNENTSDAPIESTNKAVHARAEHSISISKPYTMQSEIMMDQLAGSLLLHHVPRLSQTLAMQLSSGRHPNALELEQLANRMISYDGVPSTDITWNNQPLFGSMAAYRQLDIFVVLRRIRCRYSRFVCQLSRVFHCCSYKLLSSFVLRSRWSRGSDVLCFFVLETQPRQLYACVGALPGSTPQNGF